jgi:hypothetical protein
LQSVERRQTSSAFGSFLDARATSSVSPFSPQARNGTGVSNGAVLSPIDSRANNVALFTAAAHGQVGMVKLLLGMGMDANGLSGGSTPLHVACAKGHDLVVQELMEHGARASSTDAAGRTPLAVAEQNGHRACEAAICAHSDTIELPPHRAEAIESSLESAPAVRNDHGSLNTGHVASPVSTETAVASRGAQSALILRRKLEADSASETERKSRAAQSTSLTHLYKGKLSGEKTAKPTTTVAQSADLFREFGVTPPKATVRCMSCKPLLIANCQSVVSNFPSCFSYSYAKASQVLV